MIRNIIKVICGYIIINLTLTSTAQNRLEKIDSVLTSCGFENVSTYFSNNTYIVGIENNIYRWDLSSIYISYDLIQSTIDSNQGFSILFLEFNQPLLYIHRTETKQIKESGYHEITIKPYSNKYRNSWEKIKDINPENPSVNKFDLVLYPKFILQNIYFKKIYEIQLNICPALETTLWRGMKFTGQVIIPIVNDLGKEGDRIRPGFVTLSQRFWLWNRVYSIVTIGNFNFNRYGSDLELQYPFGNNHWNLAFNAGLTGHSNFLEGRWIKDDINTITWFTTLSYLYEKYNLQFDINYGQYINKDIGFRIDCTRFFGETTIGFYAMYTKNQSDSFTGGFHFVIPFPPKKRERKRHFRVTIPRYFDWEYNAGTEFSYGRYYETQPDERPYIKLINKNY